MYKIEFSKSAQKDAKIAKANGFKDIVDDMINVVRHNPFALMPGHRFEKLLGKLNGKYSRRISNVHRFIYEVLPNNKDLKDETGKRYDGIVLVLRIWGHTYKK